MSELRFDDLSPTERPVSIGGKSYVLKEASADSVCKWRNNMMKSAKLGPDGKPVSMDGIADSEPYLVSLCLFERDTDKEGKVRDRSVPVNVVRGWPNRIQRALFQVVRNISDLGDDDSAEAIEQRIAADTERLNVMRSNGDRGEGRSVAGNSPSATTVTSG